MTAARRVRASASVDDILDAAAQVFSTHGYAGATLDAVAGQVGLTRQGVLHYYPSKPLLFGAVLEREKTWASRAATVPTSDSETPLDALAAFLPTTDEARRRQRLQHVLQGEAVAGNAVAREYVRERTALILEHVGRRVQALADAGGLAAGWTAPTATTSIVALINGLQHLSLADADVDVVAAFRAAVAAMSQGVGR